MPGSNCKHWSAALVFRSCETLAWLMSLTSSEVLLSRLILCSWAIRAVRELALALQHPNSILGWNSVVANAILYPALDLRLPTASASSVRRRRRLGRVSSETGASSILWHAGIRWGRGCKHSKSQTYLVLLIFCRPAVLPYH